jgi:predicted amidohydrolase
MTSPGLRIAAVQMQPALGDVDTNLSSAERLIRTAFDQKAEWVILPEFFTSGMAFHPVMLDTARPVDGEPLQLLQRLAQEYGGMVGGSFLAERGAHVYNTFALVFPDGTVRFHDKDQPTMWENCYFIGGSDAGVLDTPIGAVGAALCWELIRARTIQRLENQVNLVVSGACWWGLPDYVPPEHPLHAENLMLLRSVPVTFARLLGVPVVFASHAGDFEGYKPPDETTLQHRPYMGETQIVDGHGTVLAHMAREEGEGIIVANIVPGVIDAPRLPLPDRFWIPDLTQPYLSAWNDLNRFGEGYYQRVAMPYRTRQSSV